MSDDKATYSLKIIDGEGERRELVIDAESHEVLDSDGGPTGMTLEEIAQSADFDLRVRAPVQRLDYEVVGDEDQDRMPLIASSIKLKGGEYGVIGQWTAGMTARVVIEVEIESVHFTQLKTPLGSTYGMCRVHLAGKPVGVENPADAAGPPSSNGTGSLHSA